MDSMRSQRLPLLLFCTVLSAIITAGNVVAVAPTCAVQQTTNRFFVDPVITFPRPYNYCFSIKVNNKCSTPTSPCCRSSTVATFIVDIGELCMYDVINATFNGSPVTANISTESLRQGRLSIPGLHLNASTIPTAGAQLCLELPRGTNCGAVTRLIPEGTRSWNATLQTSNSTCCPVTTLKPPPKVRCETCLVWDVLGPNGTASSAIYDFNSRNSCSLASADPRNLQRTFKTCCDYMAYWAFSGGQTLAPGQSGFNKPICTRTSLRLCGTFASAMDGQAFAADQYYGGGLREFFDNTDDTCPMSLIDSTVRLRAVVPATGALDTQCVPLQQSVENICGAPELAFWQDDYYANFPNSVCDSRAGVTPFSMSTYYEAVYFRDNSELSAYCISITHTTPVDSQSPCANATTLDRVSFWMYDDDYRRESYRGDAYMLTLEGRAVKRTNLTATWGTPGERTYNIGSLGLDAATVRAKQPKICITALRTNLWVDTADGTGYLWTALYDRSGQCCPVYYANRF